MFPPEPPVAIPIWPEFGAVLVTLFYAVLGKTQVFWADPAPPAQQPTLPPAIATAMWAFWILAIWIGVFARSRSSSGRTTAEWREPTETGEAISLKTQ